MSFGCRIRRADELLDPACGQDAVLLSSTLRDYLDQACALVRPGDRVRLVIEGAAATPEQRESISRATRNTYALRTMDAGREVRRNGSMTLQFFLCLLLSSLLLVFWGSQGGTALHEMLLVVFWFFGDYLVELILVEHVRLMQEKKKWRGMADMQLIFRADKGE